nr:MAG TPA: minor tail protein [Caudoviricetes sp.]
MNGKELDLSKIADMIAKTAENARDKLENQSDKMYSIGEDMMSSVGDGALAGAKNAATSIEAAGDIITQKYQKVLDEIKRSGKKKGDIASLFATITQIKRSDLNSFNALKDELKDIKATFTDIGEVKGLDAVLKQFGKTADKLRSIDFGFGSAFVARGRATGTNNIPHVDEVEKVETSLADAAQQSRKTVKTIQSDNIKQIQSFQDLVNLLTEYKRLIGSIKDPKLPQLYEDIETVKANLEIEGSRIQQRDMAKREIQARYKRYQNERKAYDNGGSYVSNGQIYDVSSYTDLARSEEYLKVLIALYIRCGGAVDKLSKKVKQFAEDNDIVGVLRETEEEYRNIINETHKQNVQTVDNIRKIRESVGYKEDGSNTSRALGEVFTSIHEGANIEEAADVLFQILSTKKDIISTNQELATSEERVAESVDEASSNSEQRLKQLIQNQKEWLEYLDSVLNDENFKSSGKRDATQKLKARTQSLIQQRANPDQSKQYGIEMAEVAWKKAYDEAKRQGVADSTLTRYSTDAGINYERNLSALQKERELRADTLAKAEEELATVQRTTAAINAENAELSKQQKIVNSSDDIKRFQDEYAKAAKNHAPEDMGRRYGYLMEAISGDSPTMSAVDALNELIAKEQEWKAEQEAALDAGRRKAEEMKTFIAASAEYQYVITSSKSLTTEYAQILQSISDGSMSATEGMEAFRSAIERCNAETAEAVPSTQRQSDAEQAAVIAATEAAEAHREAASAASQEAEALDDLQNKQQEYSLTNKDLSYLFEKSRANMIFGDASDARGKKIKKYFAELANAGFNLNDQKEVEAAEKLYDYLEKQGRGKQVNDKPYAMVYDFLKNLTVRIPENMEQTYEAEFPDQWKQIKKRFGGSSKFKIRVGGNGLGVDQLYSELQTVFPHIFRDGMRAEPDLLREILDAAEKGRMEAKLPKNSVIPLQQDEWFAINSIMTSLVSEAQLLRREYDYIGSSADELSSASERTAESMERQSHASKSVAGNLMDAMSEEDSISPIGLGLSEEKARDTISGSKKPTARANVFNNITNNSELQTAFQSIIEDIEQQSMTLVRSDIMDSIDKNGTGTLKFVSDDMNSILVQTWKMIDGQLKLASEKYTSTFKVDKTEGSSFDAEGYKKVALAKVQTLKAQFKGFANDENYAGILSGVENAANSIVDADSLKAFTMELNAAKESLKQLKAEMSSSKSLDPLAAAEKTLTKFPIVLDKIKTEYQSLKEFDTGDILGAEGTKVEGLMQSVRAGMDGFNDTSRSMSDRLSSFKDALKSFDQLGALMSNLRAKAKESNDVFIQILNTYKELTKLQEEQKKAEVSGATDEKKQLIADSIVQKTEKLKQLGIDINKINENTNLTTRQRNRLLKEQEEASARIKKIEVDAANSQAQKEKRQSLNYGKGAFNSETRKKDNLSAIYSSIEDNYGASAGLTDAMNAYLEKYKQFETARQKIADPTTDVTKADRDAFNKAKIEVESARKALEIYTTSYSKLEKAQNDGTLLGMDDTVDPSKLQNSTAALKAYGAEISNGKLNITGFNSTATEMYGTIDRGKGVIDQVTVALDSSTGTLYAYKTATKEVGTAWEQFKGIASRKAKEISGFLVGGSSIYAAINQIKKGITYVKEIDTALTELKKVTDETDATYKKFLTTASQTAGQIGSTVKDFTNATADFARLGYNIEQASDLAKAASVYANVGDEISDISEASDSIISTMHGFGIEAENAMTIVDKFNEVGNNFAISSSGIGQALLRSASAMSEAGNTIDESIGLITAANSVVQNPESVGTAMKTLALRIRGAKVELEDAGEDVDGMANSVSELQKKLLALTGGKVNIMLDGNTFKNTTEILREMSTVWDDMTDVNRASALELLGGKRQANVLAAVIKNFDMVEEAIKTSSDAAGSAERENEKYLNSIQGKVNQFNNAAQTMWMNFINSDAIKFVVDLGTNLVKIADDLGLVGTALAALGIKTVLPKIFSGFKDSIGAAKTAFNTARGIVSTISSFNGKGLMSFLGGKIEATSINDITHALGAEIMAQKELSKELATQILLKNGVKAEDIEGALAAMGYSSANGVLSFSFKKLATSIKEAAVAFWASPFGKIAIIVGAITAIIAIMSALIDTHDDYIDELKETSNEVSDVRNNIQSLNDELKTTQDRIDELNKKDKLSFAEEEELKNLKAQNAELERSIRLAEQKEKRLQKEASKSLNKAVESDTLFSNTTWTKYVNSKGEQVGAAEAVDTGTQYADGTYGLKEGYTEETVTGTDLQQKIEQYKYAQELLKQAKDELEELGDDAEDKEVKSAEDKVERMQQNMDDAYNAISDTMDKINEDYLSQEGVEWQYGNPDELEDWQKQMNANLKIIYDAQDKLAIASDTTGKAIESAFSRVSLQTEFQDELKTIQEIAGITGEKLKEMYDSSSDTSDTGIKAFIQSLIDCGVIANTSADELQKVVDLSLQLGGNTSEAAVANQKLARSQKRLQYYKQYKELNEYVNSLKDASKNASNLTDEQKKLISSMSQNLQALAKEIDAYDILGSQIEDAKQAFEDFEKAKESDENTDYASTAGEMLQTVIEGFQSAEMGTEAFKSAFTGLIPESVYKDLDTLEEKYTAVAQYISKDLSKYFTIKYDDEGALESAEVTTKNIETFMEEAQSKGLATFENGQWTILENNFKKFASEMGITTSALVAFGEQADKLDADWIMGDYSSFFDSFDMDTESNIDKITRSLANLDLQLINGQINANDYAQEYTKLQDALASEKANAVSDIVEYDNTTKAIDSLKTQLQEATNKLNELKTSGASEDQITNAANEAGEIANNLQEAIEKKSDLCQPSEILVEVALENIQATKDRIISELGTIDATIQLTTTDQDGNEQINSSIIQQLDDGTYTINVDANLSEEAKAKVQEYVDALNSEIQVNSYVAGTQDATTDAEGLKQTYNDLSEVIENLPDVSISTVAAQAAVNTLKDRVDNLKTAIDDLPKDVTITTTNINRTVTTGGGGGGIIASGAWSLGNAHFDGAANASGTLGADKTETSLVGELGPELRVRGNHWDMLGKNGAEFADVKKGDIIFNHKQTKSLLKNGYINSRGKAYAGGNTQSGGIFSDIRQLIIEIKKIIDKIKIDKLADKYNELVNGNVDYNKRPFVSPEYMRQAGWYEFDGDVATTYDVDYHVSDLTGKEYMIKVTPILDNGEVLSPQELDEYVDNVLNGTNDILSADKDNLVINIAPYVSDDQFAQLDEQLGNIKGPHWDLVQQYADLNNESPYTVDINPSIDQDSLTQTEAELDNISRDRYVNIYTTTVKTDTSTPFSWPMHIGAAYSSGSLGLKQNETNALVGELGPETLVRNGKYQTIGENGAEMMNLKRGDIIFNHQQTEALLKHGYVNSRGKAFATGNAHVGTSGTIFTKYATISGYGGTVPDWFGNSNILGDLSSAAGSVSSASDAAEDAADDAKQAIDFIEYRLEEIENSITNMANKVENFLDDTSQTKEKNSLYEGLVDAEKQKASTYLAAAETYNEKAAQLLSEVPAEYQEMAKNGAIAIKDFVGENEGEIADAIEEYRTWSSKAEDAENNYLASIAEISAKRLEQLQDIADDFENIVGLTEQHANLIQAEMDLLDEAGERLSENFYNELMKDSKKQIEDLNNKRASLQDILDNAVKSGDVQVGSDDWYEMVNSIYDVDDAILECKKDIEGFQNSINDLYWDNIDKLIDKIDNVDSELSHLYNLVSDEEKVVDESGNWTKDGVTALGLLAQQLEVANFKVEQYGEAIAHLEKDYAAGLYSTDEYNEKLAELKENQWGAIEAQESAKKSIIDLNKTRIQAVKDGMQKEIDAYSELIGKKKEELNLQKESHDFSKQVAEQQKNIADIEKRIAVISGDNSASAIAQKKKLQAELAQAKEELEELYYDHSVEKQQDALDKQLEDYQNNKQDEMDALDESLKNEDQIIQDSYATIAANTESLAQNLSDIADKYGITLSDSVTKPWLEGVDAIGIYQGQLDTSASAFTEQLRALKQGLVDLQVEADKTADSIIKATNSKKNSTESAKYTPPTPSTPQQSPATEPSTPAAPTKGSSVTVKSSATHFSRDGGSGTRMQSWVPGSTFTVYQATDSEVLIGRNGGYTGWVRLSDIEGYSSGAKSIDKDQFAFLDELGEELQLVPDGAGRLSYIKKGTGIIPADLTERLMEWGKLDPSSVLEQSRPVVSAPHVINNNLELNLQVGEVVHIDRADNSSIPNITKAVQDQMDNYMKNINKKLYNRVR